MAATTNRARELRVAKYLICKTTVKINQATGMEKKISSNPIHAKNHDFVFTRSHKNTKASEKSANIASWVTMPRITSPMTVREIRLGSPFRRTVET